MDADIEWGVIKGWTDMTAFSGFSQAHSPVWVLAKKVLPDCGSRTSTHSFIALLPLSLGSLPTRRIREVSTLPHTEKTGVE